MAVPYFADPTATDTHGGEHCGEVCLWMLLSLHGLDSSLRAITALTQPGRLGTPVQMLLEAAWALGASRSETRFFCDAPQAREFLTTGAPCLAFVAPSKLEGTASGAWAHAVVVLACTDEYVIYHDPDAIVGGPVQHASTQVFLDAWHAWGFAVLLVQP